MISPASLSRSTSVLTGLRDKVDVKKMMTALRIVAYALALIAMAMAVPLTLAAGDRGLVVGVLAGTLAATPYVVVRALEEVVNA
jgi:hypothetical protein